MLTWLVGGEPQALKNALFLPYMSSTVYFLFPREKKTAVSHQAAPGGSEDDLGWGQAYCDPKRARRRLPAVVGAL